MPPRKKKDDPMAAVDALPLVQELEKALACLDAVEKDVDEGKRPGKDMDAFFQQLGRVDDAAAALPELPIPPGALDDGADLADHLVEKTAHDGEVLLQVAHGKECLLRHRAFVLGRRSNGRL